jgi:hypothetical protein
MRTGCEMFEHEDPEMVAGMFIKWAQENDKILEITHVSHNHSTIAVGEIISSPVRWYSIFVVYRTKAK